MGNINSNETNNDDLVDRLRLLGYIKSKKIEYVFRAIDRGHYISSDDKNVIYKDLSWKMGNIHLSAPCVYGRVMESLSLKPGLSFLNIGSGTGYLSTMAGLLLNSNDINHGVELNKDCVDFACKKLKELKKKCNALDQFDFCEPIFIHGNFFKVLPNRRYDRVYCGAECPESYEIFIKQFVKVGGILIMPYKGNLLRIERINEDIWKYQVILPISFAPLIVPNDTATDLDQIQLPLSEPLSLQELSQLSIRREVRKKLLTEHPDLMSKYIINQKKPSLVCQNKSSFFSQLVTAPYLHKITILPMYEEYLDKKVIINNTGDKYNRLCSVADMQYLLAHSKRTLHNNSHTAMEKNDNSINKIRHSTDIIKCNDEYSSNNISEWGVSCNDYHTIPQQQKSELLGINYSTLNNETEDIRPNQIYYAHKMNHGLLSDYMKQKILQLPLPMSLRLFINNNNSNI
ncbi:protein-L-isoaspartate O-methyltransferase domain-containing protein 1-like isoform X2 [Chelonus insularis]|uniref:protein-L-isoaspartate O-methyltransferase domain-containing protein 1-like isoform X2 n=1 Tax=Chelonus insularis TaxID=460826 RepID=UPI00158BA442|nr:protein-L-isoaspartate O-methyltransferase domain-containing protein 1-like isoform X2 [Chelonus insularis]